MGASLALAGLTGLHAPAGREDRAVRCASPRSSCPGSRSSSRRRCPRRLRDAASLVESHEGRPTKIEGNPDAPGEPRRHRRRSRRRSVLGLYDPDRSQTVHAPRRSIGTWGDFLAALREPLAKAAAPTAGRGPAHPDRDASPRRRSPRSSTSLLAALPAASGTSTSRSARDNARARRAAGVRRAGRAAVPLRPGRRDPARSTPTSSRGGPAEPALRARVRRAGARPGAEAATMNRLYVVESTPTPTGAMADHRLPLRAREIEGFARARRGRARRAAVAGAPAARRTSGGSRRRRGPAAHRGRRRSCVAGERQPPAVHALAHAINEALGNVGTTVSYTAPVEASPGDQTRVARGARRGHAPGPGRAAA